MVSRGVGASVAWRLLIGLGVATLILVWATGQIAGKDTYDWFVFGAVAHGALFVVATWLVVTERVPQTRSTLLLILTVAVLARVIAFAVPHDGLTTDAYRYVWDGRIQWAGFNPYSWVPADPALTQLRDAEIYPNINQKERAVTVYPPVAQVLFAIGNVLSDDVLGPKIVMAAADLAILLILLVLLPLAGHARERIVIYAWHPLPIWEFTSQAHIDAAATAFLMLALVLVWRHRQGWAGVVLALGALTKVFPLVLAPALWRRWDWRAPAAFVATCLVFAMPYYLAGRPDLTGYFGTHIDQQGYVAGWGFHFIWALRDFGLGDMTGRTYVIGALVLLAGLGLYALFAREADRIKPSHLVLLAAAFVWFTSPHYPWYFAWIVPLLTLWCSPAALLMTVFAVVLYFPRPPGGATWTELYTLAYWLPLAVWAGTALVVALRARGRPAR